MRTDLKWLLILVAGAAVLVTALATTDVFSKAMKAALPAGVRQTSLDKKDDNPKATVTNPAGQNADDIEFEMSSSTPPVDTANTQMQDANGGNMNWTFTRVGTTKKYKGQMQAGGQPIPANGSGILFLKSQTPGKGWTYVRYSMTNGGATLYPPDKVAMGDASIDVPTGNAYPAGLVASYTFENVSAFPLEGVILEVLDSPQVILEIESSEPGLYLGDGRTYMFDAPLGPGAVFSIVWEYNDYGPIPELDTQVRITPLRSL